MKEIKTPRDILQALLDGHEIEKYSEPSNTWKSVDAICLYTKYLYDEDVVLSGYRIKPTKPSIDWSHVSENYRYLARDEDGSVWLYGIKPKSRNSNWWSRGIDDCTRASAFKSLDVGNCDWKDSLVKRPDIEEQQ